ncbi:MAG: hypothetical protein JKY96_05595, partial [Phycisphaerales bacterium]|nr:hypothetical protein [Phycisphaerales bacterium]
MAGKKQTFREKHTAPILIGLMVLVAMVCLFLVVQISGLDNKPKWWPDQVGAQENAVRLENAISTQLTAIRPGDAQQWSVALTPAEINAWLEHRLRATVETHAGSNAWTNEIESVRVAVI